MTRKLAKDLRLLSNVFSLCSNQHPSFPREMPIALRIFIFNYLNSEDPLKVMMMAPVGQLPYLRAKVSNVFGKMGQSLVIKVLDLTLCVLICLAFLAQ